MEKKYELTEETKELNGHILHRIKAVTRNPLVTTGDLGGWVESEENLSQEGNCWVFDDACVYDHAKVINNAKIITHAKIHGNAIVKNSSIVGGHSNVHQYALITNNAEVYDKSHIKGKALISGQSLILGTSKISDDVIIKDAIIDSSSIMKRSIISTTSNVQNIRILQSEINSSSIINTGGPQLIKRCIINNSIISDNTNLSGIISDNANISNVFINMSDKFTYVWKGTIRSKSDFLIIIGLGSEGRTTMAERMKNGSILVHCGCFEGPLKSFENKVKEIYYTADHLYRREYLALIELIKIHFGVKKEEQNND